MIKQESRTHFEALGAYVTTLRKSRGMTQAELARAIGVSQQAVFSYELGERRISVLVLAKLAKIFAISVEDMIGFTPTRAHTASVPEYLQQGRFGDRGQSFSELASVEISRSERPAMSRGQLLPGPEPTAIWRDERTRARTRAPYRTSSRNITNRFSSPTISCG